MAAILTPEGLPHRPRPLPETPTMPGMLQKPRLSCRGTTSSNPPPSSGESVRTSFVALTVDESLAGLALRLQRIELLLEPLLGGFAGVDRTADGSAPPRRRLWPSTSIR